MMMKIRNLLFGLAALGFMASPALAGNSLPQTVKTNTASLSILTDSKGMTLYTFDKDKPGVSNCNDGCAVKWPPLFAKADAKGEGQFSVIKRTDGKAQWAYKGMPLYFWFKDKAKGDVSGDGVKGVWHVARP
jgi:predicted lipoprotein with Yx(FWY)xxD motif